MERRNVLDFCIAEGAKNIIIPLKLKGENSQQAKELCIFIKSSLVVFCAVDQH
jgi:hypothetical protein